MKASGIAVQTGVISAMLCLAFGVASPIVRAETAEVLPKGIFNVDGDIYFYKDITKRYDPDGDEELLGADYNATLDSTVFPALQPLDAFVPGNAAVGDSVVDFKFDYTTAELDFRYGLTNDVSIGIKFPYFDAKNRVNATLDTSTANVGKNPLYNPAGPFPLNSPVVPLGTGIGETPLTDEDVQELLGAGIDVNGDGMVDVPGFGYKRFETWDGKGLGDIEAGAKWKFYEASPWRLALAGGVRLPTGEKDDPDDLTDLAFGDSQTDLLFRFYADYLGVERWTFNATLFVDIQLPDEEVRRVPVDVNEPITANKEKVDRDLGDIIELDLMALYSFAPGWSAYVQYRGSKKFKDDIDGSQGFNYKSLEDETDWTSHIGKFGLSYSTLQRYQEKKFPIPMYAGLEYRNRFAGSNNINKSEYIALNVGVYF